MYIMIKKIREKKLAKYFKNNLFYSKLLLKVPTKSYIRKKKPLGNAVEHFLYLKIKILLILKWFES